MLFSDLELARRVEAASGWIGMEYAETLARLHPEVRAAALAVAGGYAVFAGVGSPATQAVGLGLERPVTAEQLDELEAFFRNRGSRIEIEVCPLADGSLVQLLGQRGYRVTEWSNVLVQPIGRAGLGPAVASRVQVRRARAADAQAWANIMGRCFFEGQEPDATLKATFEASLHMPSAACFFGLVEGEAAGAAALLAHQGVAILAGAGTLPEFRKRGVQSALLDARLRFAVAAGCDLMVIMTLPGTASQRNAERQGFRVAYTRAKMGRE